MFEVAGWESMKWKLLDDMPSISKYANIPLNNLHVLWHKTAQAIAVMRHAEKGESAVQGHAKGLSSPFSLLFLSWSDVIWIQQHTKCEKEEEAVFIGISRKGGGGGGGVYFGGCYNSFPFWT